MPKQQSPPSSDKVLGWLREPDNPPDRYLTLTNLLGKSGRNPEVKQAKANLMEYPVTRGILERVDECFAENHGAYQKYTGRYWQAIFLGQFLADGRDPRVTRLAESILADHKWVNKTGGQCLTANLLAALTRLGHGRHPRVREEREALARRLVADDGIRCTAMDYSLLPRCYMAQPKLLLCFAQVPPRDRSPAIRAATDLLVRNLLDNEVFRYLPGKEESAAWQALLERTPSPADLPRGHTVKQWLSEQRDESLASRGLGLRQPKRGWLRFGFPLHYNSDALEALYSLALAGQPLTPQLGVALAAVEDKQTRDGRWLLDSSLNGKMLVDVEEKRKPSKWITYFARYVLQHFRR